LPAHLPPHFDGAQAAKAGDTMAGAAMARPPATVSSDRVERMVERVFAMVGFLGWIDHRRPDPRPRTIRAGRNAAPRDYPRCGISSGHKLIAAVHDPVNTRPGAWCRRPGGVRCRPGGRATTQVFIDGS
jgi:hypothetical protein